MGNIVWFQGIVVGKVGHTVEDDRERFSFIVHFYKR